MYDRMVSAILDHRLPPGTKLVEDKLAAAFGVSRTRVRPVLVRLANEQVVTLTPNRGASIAQLTPQEALEVFEARRLLEPRLVELFIANATDADIAVLRTCIDDEEAARASGDMRRAIRLSGDFHLHIAQAAGRRAPDAGAHPARAGLAHLAHPDDLQPQPRPDPRRGHGLRLPRAPRADRPSACATRARRPG